MIKNKIVFFNIIDIFLIFNIILLFYITQKIYTPSVILIPKANINKIISYLNNKQYDINIADSFLLRILGVPQNGWIDLKKNNMSKIDFLYKLTTSKAALKLITLIPGETYYFFLDKLTSNLALSKEKLTFYYNKLSYKKDGNILAESYNIPIGMNEKQVISYLFNYTNKEYQKLSKKIFGNYNKKKWFYYITIASIIQKEAANKKEMPIVSSVIYNRIKNNMKLQMDGTLNYGKYSNIKITPKRIKEDISNYNTYKILGIPNNPISSVSLETIKYAIFPAKTKYLYFVKKGNGHIFSTTYKKHLDHINNIKLTKGIK
jgi:UPF0755 protein